MLWHTFYRCISLSIRVNDGQHWKAWCSHTVICRMVFVHHFDYFCYFRYRKSRWSPSTPDSSWLWRVESTCWATSSPRRWSAREKPSWSSWPTTALLSGKMVVSINSLVIFLRLNALYMQTIHRKTNPLDINIDCKWFGFHQQRLDGGLANFCSVNQHFCPSNQHFCITFLGLHYF